MKPRIRRSTHPDWAWECEGGTITSYGPSIEDAFWTWAWAYARNYSGNVTPA